jgi:hypothetical protein
MTTSVRRLELVLASLYFLCACAPTPAPVAPLVSAIPTSAPAATATPAAAAEHVIGIRVVDGTGEFFNRLTGEKFIPRGNNHIRLSRARAPCLEPSSAYHATFNVGIYDAATNEATLSAMQADGYNMVRVFINGNCIGRREGGLSEEYMANLADYLRLAKAHGLYVMLTADDPPTPGYSATMKDSQDIDWENRQFLTSDGMRVNGRFWQDLIEALLRLNAPLDAVFAYELRNEQFYMGDHLPLSMTSGRVTTGNGSTYDMAVPEDKERMMGENLVYWIDGVREAILKVDPTALVAVGFFWPQKPHPARIGDVRLVTTAPAIWDARADFIDLHPYPGGELGLPEYVDNFGMAGMQEKPIIMGEFGAARPAYSSEERAAQALRDWQVQSCDFGFDGWLLWTYDTEVQADFYNGMTGQGLINRALSPKERPDPCQAGEVDLRGRNLTVQATAKASRELRDQPASAAIDGELQRMWGAGAFAPQWIQVDLGEVSSVGLIRLVVSQAPPGNTVHEIWAGPTADALTLLHTFEEYTLDQQLLEFKPEGEVENVQIVRIRTTASPSWVAWREIEVLAR